MVTMLKIENLKKSYGSKEVLHGIDLEVQDGEIFGFIGHNGAGKTTTIKAVVGIITYEKGKITIDGIDNKEKPLECKKIMAYIPDNPDLYPNLTGLQYLNFIGNVYKVEKHALVSRIEHLANEFEIYGNLADTIGSYSHGMKQKLAIISALIHEPKLLILDEPFVGLDPKASFKLKELMKQLCAKGSSIFFSTHVLEVAEKLCDKIAIIKDGRIVVSGNTSELIEDQSLEEIFLGL